MNCEFVAEEIFEGCTAAQLNGLFASEGSKVFFEGDDAKPVPDHPGLTYVYFPPLEVGPFRAQTRLTCEIGTPGQGKTEVRVMEINPGVVDTATGEVEWQKDPSELLDASSQVVMRWRQLGDRVRVSQEVSQRLLIKIPSWFPVPDNVFESLIKPSVEQSIRTSQAGAFERLRGLLASSAGAPAAETRGAVEMA